MAKFQELIKKYEKIRPYLKDFLVYGTKGRSDYVPSKRRSYDNEKRRIENILSQYMEETETETGKKIYLQKDSLFIEDNPFFATLRSKSFTKNDLFLHFTLLDIIDDEPKSLQDICLELDNYLVEDCKFKTPDTMTVRNKLKEMVNQELVTQITVGNKRLFVQPDNSAFIDDLDESSSSQLYQCLSFFENTLPLGIVGFFIKENMSIEARSHFAFKHSFDSHIFNDEILLKLFEAMDHNNTIQINTYQSTQAQSNHYFLPVQVMNNLETGRRYLVAHSYKTKCLTLFRLDRIIDIRISTETGDREFYLNKLKNLKKDAFGIMVRERKNLEHIELTLQIHDKNEQFILERLRKEGQLGFIDRIDKHVYKYTIDVIDANEISPWIKSFIGRIISFKCSNTEVYNRFYNDLTTLQRMYDL